MKVEVRRTLKNIVSMRYEDGVLKVLANCFLSRKRLKQIIQDNSDWIHKRQEQADKTALDDKAAETRPRKSIGYSNQVLRDVYSARKTILMGDIIEVAASVSSKTYIEADTLYIPEKYYQSRDGRVRAIKTYLKKMATLYVSNEISDFGSGISLCPTKIEFKDIGDAWLKCSQASQRILTIDYRIVQLPLNLRLYVIAHAFAHFTNPMHDDKFDNSMSNILPHYRDCEKLLAKFNFLQDI